MLTNLPLWLLLSLAASQRSESQQPKQPQPSCEALKRYQEHERTIPNVKEFQISEDCPPKKVTPKKKPHTPARKDGKNA